MRSSVVRKGVAHMHMHMHVHTRMQGAHIDAGGSTTAGKAGQGVKTDGTLYHDGAEGRPGRLSLFLYNALRYEY